MRPAPHLNILHAGLAFALLAGFEACHRAGPATAQKLPPSGSPTPPQATGSAPPQTTAALPEFEDRPVSVQEGNAVWYDVPADSLAQRRAGPNELSAASDILPLHSYARVTRDENGKSVIVHITDKGLHKTGVIIDLDRPAAEKLEMVKAGKAHVKVEALALKNPSDTGPLPLSGAQTPSSQ